MGRPWPVFVLVGVLAVLAVGGFYGGGAMLLDPTGRALGMDVVLPSLPVGSFVVPGIFLVVVMGLAPLALAAAPAVCRRFVAPHPPV